MHLKREAKVPKSGAEDEEVRNGGEWEGAERVNLEFFQRPGRG